MSDDVVIDAISKRIDAYDRIHTIGCCNRNVPGSDLHAELDSFVTSLSEPGNVIFNGLGERWHEIDELEARYTLTYILSHDIAYGTPEIPESDASVIVQDFLSYFGNELRFFSNGTFNRQTGGWGGYGFVADATCETGVVVVGKSKIGMLWCHDED